MSVNIPVERLGLVNQSAGLWFPRETCGNSTSATDFGAKPKSHALLDSTASLSLGATPLAYWLLRDQTVQLVRVDFSFFWG